MTFKKTIRKIISLGRHYFYEEGIELYNQGRFVEALERFTKLTGKGRDPNSLHSNLASFYSGIIHRNLGLLVLHKGDYEEAVSHFTMALEFNPTHYEIYNYLGVAYNNWKKYQKAMIAFSKVMELAPELLSLRYKVAIVLYNLQKYDQARDELSRLITLYPQFADYHYHLGVVNAHQKCMDEAQKSFSKALELNPQYFQAKVQLALTYGAQGEFQSAIRMLKELIQQKPAYADLHYTIGVIKGAQKDWKGAAKGIKKALELNPNYSNAHFILGILSLRDFNYEEARKAISKALDLGLEEGKQVLAKNILDYLEKKNDLQSTEGVGSDPAGLDPLQEEYVDAMFRAIPNHLTIVPDYFELLEKFGSKWDRPLLTTLAQLYEDELVEKPDFPDLAFQLGMVYMQMEAWDKAVLAFVRAIEVNPHFFKVRIQLYKVFLKIEMQEKAKTELEYLLNQGIRFPDLCQDLATIYFKEGNWEASLNLLNEVMATSPGFEKACLLASIIYERQGAIDKAVAVLTRADREGKDTSEVRIRLIELEKKRIGV